MHREHYLRDLQTTGRRARLEPGRPVFLGRSASCDVQICDPYVSRRHCELMLDPLGRVLIHDRSKNGTLVGHLRVVHIRQLLAGEVIRVGPCRLILEVEGDDDSVLLQGAVARDFGLAS